MPSKYRTIWKTLTIIVFFVSLAGIPSNLSTWIEWAPRIWNFLIDSYIQLSVLFISGTLFFSADRVWTLYQNIRNSGRKRRQEIADRVSDLMHEGIQLELQPVETEETYRKWKENFENWYNKTQGYIGNNISHARLRMFQNARVDYAITFSRAFDSHHHEDLNFLRARTDFLRITAKHFEYGIHDR